MSARFGALLRAFRLRTVAAVRRGNGRGTQLVLGPLDQATLARRAGIDPAHVNRLEIGRTREPSYRVAVALAEALELDRLDAARLLVAAGYWPFPESDEDDTELALAVLFAVVDGDCRPLDDDTASGPVERVL